MKVTVNKQKVASYLADGIAISFSGTDYQNKLLIQSILFGYLNQRKKAIEFMSDIQYGKRISNALEHIRLRFELINKFDYWRHCLEIRNAEPLILQTLPSEKGYHKRIRKTIIGLIHHCKKVTESTHNEYYKSLSA